MSKDSRLLLYASFNDSLVEEMYTLWFGDSNKQLYPEIRSLRYPKVNISYFKIFFVNVIRHQYFKKDLQ